MAEKLPPTPPISTRLAMTPINHFMSRKVIYATPTTTIRMAMQMMLTHKISGLAVVDDTQSLLGVYSELDAMLQGSSQALDLPIKFTRPAKSVRADTLFRDVLITLVKLKVKRFPIVDTHNRLIGIVSRRDLMKAIFDDISQAKT